MAAPEAPVSVLPACGLCLGSAHDGPHPRSRRLAAAIAQCIASFVAAHPAAASADGASGIGAQTQQLLDALDAFDGAPFTLQRMCELIAEPARHYGMLRKLVYSFERLLSVSSTIEVPVPEEEQAGGAAPMDTA